MIAPRILPIPTHSVSHVLRLLFVSLTFSIAGCGKPGGPERAAVEGQVTLDGQSIAQGSITFRPSGNTRGMTAGGPIVDGKFRIEAERGPVVGTNRVAIYASRKTGRKVQAPMAEPGIMTDEQVEAVPARFNTQTTLERTVVSGPNKLDFDLQSK